jgi:hypothetical protein
MRGVLGALSWRRAWATFAVVAGVGVVACSGKTIPTNGLMLVVETDMATPRDFDSFQLQVDQETSTGDFHTLWKNDYSIPATTLPNSFGIAAGSSADQVARVRVTAFKQQADGSEQPIVLREMEVQVPRDAVDQLLVDLSSKCAGAGKVTVDGAGNAQSTCQDSTQTCQPQDGSCAPTTVITASSLTPYVPGDEKDAGVATTVVAIDGSTDSTAPGPDAQGDDATGGGPSDAPTSTPPDDVSAPPPDSSVADSGPDAPASTVMEAGPPALPVTFNMSPFTVQPGQEVYECQQFSNPFGQDVDLVKMDGTALPNARRVFLFNMDPSTSRNTAAPIGDCPGGGSEYHPFAYFSQGSTNGEYVATYPQTNMGYAVPKANGLMMFVDYVNTGASPVTPTVSITLTPAAPGAVTVHVGNILLNNSAFTDPPGTSNITKTFDPSTTLPSSYWLVSAWSFMTRYGTNFTASGGGSQFYSTPDWDQPPLDTFATTVPLMNSQTLSFTCTFSNPTGNVITAGTSVSTNAMCQFIGQYYSSASSNPDVIEQSL